MLLPRFSWQDSNADMEKSTLKGFRRHPGDRKPAVVNEVQRATPVTEPVIPTEAISNLQIDQPSRRSTDDTVDQTRWSSKRRPMKRRQDPEAFHTGGFDYLPATF
jgi:hypothetical protein